MGIGRLLSVVKGIAGKPPLQHQNSPFPSLPYLMTQCLPGVQALLLHEPVPDQLNRYSSVGSIARGSQAWMRVAAPK